jgi:hypothetical protein
VGIFYQLHQQLVGHAAPEGDAVTSAGYYHAMAAVVQNLHLGPDPQSEAEKAAGYILTASNLHNTRPFPFWNETKDGKGGI